MRNHISMMIMLTALLFGPMQVAAAEPLRDPTRPYSARPIVSLRTATFKVSAIFVSEERRVAIVNGQRVAEGDQVSGAKVVEILSDRLRLNLQGKEITARLLPATVRN